MPARSELVMPNVPEFGVASSVVELIKLLASDPFGSLKFV